MRFSLYLILFVILILILKIISIRVGKKFFLFKQENLNYFCTGCPKRARDRGGKTIFFFHKGIRNKKNGKKSRILRFGLLSKGQKAT